jgi:hypothetical protein
MNTLIVTMTTTCAKIKLLCLQRCLVLVAGSVFLRQVGFMAKRFLHVTNNYLGHNHLFRFTGVQDYDSDDDIEPCKRRTVGLDTKRAPGLLPPEEIFTMPNFGFSAPRKFNFDNFGVTRLRSFQ